MITATHYARAIDRHSIHIDALEIDRDELMLELLYRSDAGSCGRGWKGTKGACVRKSASQLTAAKASLGNLAKGGVVDKGRKERRARIAQLKAKMAGKTAPAEPAPKAKKLPTLPVKAKAPANATKPVAPPNVVAAKTRAKTPRKPKEYNPYTLPSLSKAEDRDLAAIGGGRSVLEILAERKAADKAAREAKKAAKKAAQEANPIKKSGPRKPRKSGPRKPKEYNPYTLPSLSKAEDRDLGGVGSGRSVLEILAERKAADKAAREAKKAARAAKKAVKK